MNHGANRLATHPIARSSILVACRHFGKTRQSAHRAISGWKVFPSRRASRSKCWYCRKRRDRRRPAAEACGTPSSISVSRSSQLPARTGTHCSDFAGHPHLGLVGFPPGSAISSASRASRFGRRPHLRCQYHLLSGSRETGRVRAVETRPKRRTLDRQCPGGTGRVASAPHSANCGGIHTTSAIFSPRPSRPITCRNGAHPSVSSYD